MSPDRPPLSSLTSAALDRLVSAVESAVERAVGRHAADAERRADERHQQVLATLRDWERRTRRDLFTGMDLEALRTSSELTRTQMQAASVQDSPEATLRYGLRRAPAHGLALEFGVASGRTLGVIAQERHGRDVFGFDSFEGLPEDWRPGYAAGTFAGEPPQVPGAELVIGLFDAVLPDFLRATPGDVTFLHVDCDLYSSTVTVLDAVGPRLIVGSVVVFDDYHNHPGWQDDEYRAWQEFVERRGVSYEYLAFSSHDEQVALRITGIEGR